MQETYGDNQLIGLIRESSEEAKDLIFDKYKYIIDVEVKRFSNISKIVGYDYNDLYQDGLIGFITALNEYREDKNMSLSSFITLCIRRNLYTSIIKTKRKKNEIITQAMSIDYTSDNSLIPIKELLSDNSQNDPLLKMLAEEQTQDFLQKVKKSLSNNEFKVYNLLTNGINYNEIALIMNKTPKQIDNCIQRIKSKLKLMLTTKK